MAETVESVAGEVLSIGSAAAEKKTETKPAEKPVRGELKRGFWWGTGRRKSSVARVRIRPGEGKLVINKKELTSYFDRLQDQNAVLSPLKAVDAAKSFDIFINVKGGGTTGQSGAARLGIARALRNYDSSLVHVLREGGHLTRDARMVERKKPGQSGARRRYQFSKR
jgi:small subunit ribosomal protein S9